MPDEKKKRPMTEARKAANSRYDNAAYDKIMLRVRAGRKTDIEEHAAQYQPQAGEIGKAGYSPAGSLQGFINRAIDETMERDINDAWASQEGAIPHEQPRICQDAD